MFLIVDLHGKRKSHVRRIWSIMNANEETEVEEQSVTGIAGYDMAFFFLETSESGLNVSGECFSQCLNHKILQWPVLCRKSHFLKVVQVIRPINVVVASAGVCRQVCLNIWSLRISGNSLIELQYFLRRPLDLCCCITSELCSLLRRKQLGIPQGFLLANCLMAFVLF